MKNESISMLAEDALNLLLGTMNRNKYFGLVGYEGTAYDNKTVLLTSYRAVDVDLNSFELLMGVFLLLNCYNYSTLVVHYHTLEHLTIVYVHGA